jgi:MFS family permease
MLAAPLAGALSDRLGERWRIVVGSLVLGAAGMALLTLNAWAAIGIGIAAAALVRGSSEAMVTALTGDLVRTEQRGRAIGVVHTASDLGSAVAPPIAYLALPWIGLKGVYLGCAALFVIQLGLVLWYRYRSTADLRSDPRADRRSAEV